MPNSNDLLHPISTCLIYTTTFIHLSIPLTTSVLSKMAPILLKAHILCYVLWFSTLSLAGHAQTCPELSDGTRAVSGELGYGPRGTYCEGLVTNTNSSGTTLELVSFSVGPINFADASDEELEVKIPNVTNESLRITGKSYNLAVKYRLDFNLKAGETRKIKTGSIIHRSQISHGNLGLWGYQTVAGKELFYPVTVRSKLIRTVQVHPNYSIKLVKNASIKSMSYRLAPYVNGEIGQLSPPVPLDSERIQGDRISLELDRSIPKGGHLLRINYTQGNSQSQTKDFILHIP
jgi:hypothetical protein